MCSNWLRAQFLATPLEGVALHRALKEGVALDKGPPQEVKRAQWKGEVSSSYTNPSAYS